MTLSQLLGFNVATLTPTILHAINRNKKRFKLELKKLYIIVFLKARSGSEKMAYFMKMAFLFMSAESS